MHNHTLVLARFGVWDAPEGSRYLMHLDANVLKKNESTKKAATASHVPDPGRQQWKGC